MLNSSISQGLAGNKLIAEVVASATAFCLHEQQNKIEITTAKAVSKPISTPIPTENKRSLKVQLER